MRLLVAIAMRHLLARKRQSLVSLMGIILGVAFFLAIASLMQGSEKDFIRRLVDNSPHITVSDTFRDVRPQPAYDVYKGGAVDVRHVKPVNETRGIRNYREMLLWLRSNVPDIAASSVQTAQILVNSGGNEYGVTVSGMIPDDITKTTTIGQYMVSGSIDALNSNLDGILIGAELARKLTLIVGDNISVSSATGQVRTMKIVGIFRVGRASYDEGQAFANLKRVQSMIDRANRINSIIIKLPDANQAREISKIIEQNYGYKSVSWQEASEDIMSTIRIRNMILYTVVSAVLIVAAFGIYNVISTIVMEKQRDIAIMKSNGFYAGDVKTIFVLQGVVLGLVGAGIGLPLGSAIMLGLMQIQLKQPFSSDKVQMPIDWSYPQFLIAAAFAIVASVIASWLPARRAASVHPVDILRGS